MKKELEEQVLETIEAVNNARKAGLAEEVIQLEITQYIYGVIDYDTFLADLRGAIG